MPVSSFTRLYVTSYVLACNSQTTQPTGVMAPLPLSHRREECNERNATKTPSVYIQYRVHFEMQRMDGWCASEIGMTLTDV